MVLLRFLHDDTTTLQTLRSNGIIPITILREILRVHICVTFDYNYHFDDTSNGTQPPTHFSTMHPAQPASPLSHLTRQPQYLPVIYQHKMRGSLARQKCPERPSPRAKLTASNPYTRHTRRHPVPSNAVNFPTQAYLRKAYYSCVVHTTHSHGGDSLFPKTYRLPPIIATHTHPLRKTEREIITTPIPQTSIPDILSQQPLSSTNSTS